MPIVASTADLTISYITTGERCSLSIVHFTDQLPNYVFVYQKIDPLTVSLTDTLLTHANSVLEIFHNNFIGILLDCFTYLCFHVSFYSRIDTLR